jgi:hypothetical protein
MGPPPNQQQDPQSGSMNLALRFPRRATLGATLLALAWLLSFFFFGTGVNLAMLACVSAVMLLAIGFVGATNILEAFGRNPLGLGLALSALAYLVVIYRLSLSPDNSFAPSWVLAASPLAFLCGTAVASVDGLRRAMTLGIGALVVMLAVNSSVRFVVLAERAFQPLLDANNYGTLMYLIWIPLVHRTLLQQWRSGTSDRGQRIVGLLASFFLLLTIFATRSRTSALIVVGSFAFWAALTQLKHLSWGPLLKQIGVAALAFVTWETASTAHGVQPRGIEFGGGMSVRMELLHSAFAMLEQHPFGTGVFCFPLLYPTFRSLLEQDTAGLFVHNDYVQFLVEGGVPMLLLLLAFVAAILRRVVSGLRQDVGQTGFERLGIALALAAVCAHALVNFVFYSLPLGILIGLMAAQLFAGPDRTNAASQPTPIARRSMALAMTVGWVMWLYLLLDVMIIDVFQGQAGLPFAASIRGDDRRMLEFARVAQRLNGNRGIPALAEAMLLNKSLRAEPYSRYLREQTYEHFHVALSVDPWNPMIYVQFAEFLDGFVPPGQRAPGESSEELLAASIGLDPVYLPGIDGLLALYAARGDDGKRYALLRKLVYPWMPTVRRRDPAASDRYFELLKQYASSAGDTAFLDEVEQRQAALSHFVPVAPTYWFF